MRTGFEITVIIMKSGEQKLDNKRTEVLVDLH